MMATRWYPLSTTTWAKAYERPSVLPPGRKKFLLHFSPVMLAASMP